MQTTLKLKSLKITTFKNIIHAKPKNGLMVLHLTAEKCLLVNSPKSTSLYYKIKCLFLNSNLVILGHEAKLGVLERPENQTTSTTANKQKTQTV